MSFRCLVKLSKIGTNKNVTFAIGSGETILFFFFSKFLVAVGYSMMAMSPVGFASHQNPIIVLEEVASSDEI